MQHSKGQKIVGQSHYVNLTRGTKYSRVDLVKFYGRQPLKNLKGYDSA